MPASTAASSSAAAQLYPLAILDAGAHSFRLVLQPKPPTSASSIATSSIHKCPNAIVRTRVPHKRVYIGSEIEESCGDFSGLTVRLPIERGLLTDWVAQKALWDVEIARALSVLPRSSKKKENAANSHMLLLEGWNLIVTEAYFNLPEIEQGLEVLFFEEYGIKGIWRTTAAQLAFFAPLTVVKAKEDDGEPEIGEPTISDEAVKTASSPMSAVDDGEMMPPPTMPAAATRWPKRQSSGVSVWASHTKKPSSPQVAVHIPRHRRSEAALILDLGHSYTHVVPIWQGEVLWAGVKRLEIGGKLLNNFLKETISFRQWDMMEETWILDRLKEQALFAAASEHEDAKGGPSTWRRKELLDVSRKSRRGTNPIEQQFVLPDYADPKVARNPALRYGHKRCGPGRGGDVNCFIADPQVLIGELRKWEADAKGDPQYGEADEDDEQEEEHTDEDYAESSSESEIDQEPPPKKPREILPNASFRKPNPTEGEDEQLLTLSQERWQVPELFFNPQQIGTYQLPAANFHSVFALIEPIPLSPGVEALSLPALIMASVNAATQDDEALQGTLVANVVLIGGLAGLPGLRRRIEADLQALVPDDYVVRVRIPPRSGATEVHAYRDVVS